MSSLRSPTAKLWPIVTSTGLRLLKSGLLQGALLAGLLIGGGLWGCGTEPEPNPICLAEQTLKPELRSYLGRARKAHFAADKALASNDRPAAIAALKPVFAAHFAGPGAAEPNAAAAKGRIARTVHADGVLRLVWQLHLADLTQDALKALDFAGAAPEGSPERGRVDELRGALNLSLAESAQSKAAARQRRQTARASLEKAVARQREVTRLAQSCPATSGGAVGVAVVAQLSMVRSVHLLADLDTLDGEAEAAERRLADLIEEIHSPRSPELHEVMADTHARLASLLIGRGAFGAAHRAVDHGLRLATQPSHFRGRLFELRGAAFEGQFHAAVAESAEASRLLGAAVDAFGEAVKIHEKVVERLLELPSTPQRP